MCIKCKQCRRAIVHQCEQMQWKLLIAHRESFKMENFQLPTGNQIRKCLLWNMNNNNEFLRYYVYVTLWNEIPKISEWLTAQQSHRVSSFDLLSCWAVRSHMYGNAVHGTMSSSTAQVSLAQWLCWVVRHLLSKTHVYSQACSVRSSYY